MIDRDNRDVINVNNGENAGSAALCDNKKIQRGVAEEIVNPRNIFIAFIIRAVGSIASFTYINISVVIQCNSPVTFHQILYT